MNKRNPYLPILLSVMLVFISLACGGNNNEHTTSYEEVQQEEVASNNEYDPCAGKLSENYQGVFFCYPSFIATSTNNYYVQDEYSEMSEYFNTPSHVEFEFNRYAISPTFMTPALRVYPVSTYIAINSYTAESISQLQSLLSSKPQHAENIPFLPQWEAAQMFTSKVGYVAFSNGEGIRYITQYGQDFWPINNEDMFYTFQGLTYDGQYYISAVFPISNAVLPANGASYDGDINELAAAYDTYFTEMSVLLYNQDDYSFSPTIPDLDELISTISINQ